MTKEQLKKHCDSEFENIDAVVRELFSVVSPDKSEYTAVELTAIATFIHQAYNGIQNILKRILLFDGLTIKEDTATWNKDLLEKSVQLGIIPPELYQILFNYLTFSHFFINAYSINLKWEKLKVLVDGLKDTLTRLKSEVSEYIYTIET
ncbi:MAG: hypothetical protein HZC12_09925 [Nitrospirae bacterium]|nr:hypothetical protein [Nitrospirota bacterium]